MDHLFNNTSKEELRQYIDVIDHIRKKKRSKKQKIKAIEQQINYMNLMHNTGVQMSGKNNFVRSTVNSSFLSRFAKPDIDNLFSDMKIGKGKNLSHTLGNFQSTYSQLQYLDLISPNKIDENEEKGNAPTVDLTNDNAEDDDDDFSTKLIKN